MPRVIETASLFVLIVLAGLRPLVAESYESAGNPMTQALGNVSDPSPVRTLVFDALILLSACGWLAARAIGPGRRYRRTGLEWGLGLIAVAVVISCIFAGNKRLAVNASVDWLCYPVLTIALVQLMHRPWHRRLLLAAVLAAALAQTSQCFEQYFVGFEETKNHYESIKADFWARQGVELDSAKVELFEQRMLAHEASGFLPHSNIAGSYLVLCGLTAIGLTIARGRRAAGTLGYFPAAVCTIATAAILCAAALTKSLGAIVAAVVGLVGWLLFILLRSWIDAHRRKAFVIGWGCAVAGMAAVVGHGLAHGKLPHTSLTFRWQYWCASADLVADHALTGVGRENFGRHYLQYKPIDSPEEVANPHNLFVQAGADWGLLGLVGVIVCLVGASAKVTRPAITPKLSPTCANGMSGRGNAVIWAGVLLATITLSRLVLLDTDDPYFLYYASVSTGLAWVIGFACFMIRDGKADDPSEGNPPVVATAVAIALFTFVLHDMINFALFVPGSATTFFALLAVGIAERSPVEPVTATGKSPARWVAVGVVAAITVAMLLLAVRPVAKVTRSLRLAQSDREQLVRGPITSQPAARHYLDAIAADPLDPTPGVARSKWLRALSSLPRFRDEALPAAVESLKAAIPRDPFKVNPRRLLMRLYRAKAQHTRSPDDYLAAVRAAEEALELYPLDPSGMWSLGDCRMEAGEATGSEELLHQAVEAYQQALDLDASRPQWERIRGFRDREREAIQSKIRHLQELLAAGG